MMSTRGAGDFPIFHASPQQPQRTRSRQGMAHERQFYIDGEWVDPIAQTVIDVIDPSTEEAIVQIALGGTADVDRAVAAAKAAFPSYSRTSKQERLALLRRILEVYNARHDEIARTLSREMGAPIRLAVDAQAAIGAAHLAKMIESLEAFEFEQLRGTTLIAKEPIGVCGM